MKRDRIIQIVLVVVVIVLITALAALLLSLYRTHTAVLPMTGIAQPEPAGEPERPQEMAAQ